MRDPKRIKEFCNQLAEVWEKNYPDWRFGQLICNVFGLQSVPKFLYMEDDHAQERFVEYGNQYQDEPSVINVLDDKEGHNEQLKAQRK